MVDHEFVYFYHSNVSKTSQISLYKMTDKIAKIVENRQVKKIILYHDESSWENSFTDLKLGFGAILTTDGQLIEFTQDCNFYVEKPSYIK